MLPTSNLPFFSCFDTENGEIDVDSPDVAYHVTKNSPTSAKLLYRLESMRGIAEQRVKYRRGLRVDVYCICICLGGGSV